MEFCCVVCGIGIWARRSFGNADHSLHISSVVKEDAIALTHRLKVLLCQGVSHSRPRGAAIAEEIIKAVVSRLFLNQPIHNGSLKRIIKSEWSELRLRDRIGPELHILFVGINPGVRSAITGHHFAGYSNRFWKLLADSRLVPKAITYQDDDRLPEWGLGITNLIARPSPGIDDLRPAEYIESW